MSCWPSCKRTPTRVVRFHSRLPLLREPSPLLPLARRAPNRPAHLFLMLQFARRSSSLLRPQKPLSDRLTPLPPQRSSPQHLLDLDRRRLLRLRAPFPGRVCALRCLRSVSLIWGHIAFPRVFPLRRAPIVQQPAPVMRRRSDLLQMSAWVLALRISVRQVRPTRSKAGM